MQNFIDGGAIITAAPDNGSSSFVQMLSNIMVKDGNTVLYYNPSGTINRNFVKEYYNGAYSNVCFVICSLENFIDYISEIGDIINFDYIIIDPGDILSYNNQLVLIRDLVNCNIICTSQIREDPNQGGRPYSTLDKINKKYYMYGDPLFRYSVWIRNVTEKSLVFNNKYIELYNYYRDKETFIDRNIAKFSLNGKVLNEKDYNYRKST